MCIVGSGNCTRECVTERVLARTIYGYTLLVRIGFRGHLTKITAYVLHRELLALKLREGGLDSPALA